MNAEQAEIIDQAIAWHLRLPDASADDWGNFIAWLEADPAHASALMVARPLGQQQRLTPLHLRLWLSS